MENSDDELNNQIKNLQTEWQSQFEITSKCGASDKCVLHFCNILSEKYSKAVKLCDIYFENKNLEEFIEGVLDLGGIPINDLKLKKYIKDPKFKEKINAVGENTINMLLDTFEEVLEEAYLWDF